jgi:uncharacterized protein DUF4440
MRATVRTATQLIRIGPVGLLAFAIAASAQEPVRRRPPAADDADLRLTEQTRRLERAFADAIIHKDSARLERILAPGYTLRIADIPQGSAPRPFWMDIALHRVNAGSVELRHLAARGVGPNVTVAAFIHRQTGSSEGHDVSGEFYMVDLWKRNGGGWQLAARYSSPMGPPVNRGNRAPPPPTDVDQQLTDTLERLERQLGEAAVHGYQDTLEWTSLVGPDFTMRSADAPERSVPRAEWARSASGDKIEALEERFHAARRLADDVAVVSLLLTQKASADGRDRSGDVYVVDVWKRHGGRWQLVARYSSPRGRGVDPTPPP